MGPRDTLGRLGGAAGALGSAGTAALTVLDLPEAGTGYTLLLTGVGLAAALAAYLWLAYRMLRIARGRSRPGRALAVLLAAALPAYLVAARYLPAGQVSLVAWHWAAVSLVSAAGFLLLLAGPDWAVPTVGFSFLDTAESQRRRARQGPRKRGSGRLPLYDWTHRGPRP